MAGNAGKGRPQGSRNKLTEETLALTAEGESPLALMIRVSRDDLQDLSMRLNAARWAAPFLHSKPYPEQPTVSFRLPGTITTAAGLTGAHAEILKAVAEGNLAVTLARDLSAILETQRRLVETADLEARIAKLEERASQ